jgi:ComF family protein
MADYIRTQYEFLPEVLLPVPLHRQRIRQRGFNQAGEIAKVVAKHLHIPFSQNYLLRDKRTHAQTYLKAKGRNKNVKNAFKIKKKIEFRHIALIDDVITTGATLRQVSLALKKAGVERIDICCVARAEAR